MATAILQSELQTTATTSFRPGTTDDLYTIFEIFEETLADLSQRFGSRSPTSWQNPEAMAKMWQQRSSLYSHLVDTADQFWIAEQEGQAIGFARSTVRDGVQQLTELFVLPGVQSAGTGRELITRAFPARDTRHKSIIATTDFRAQTLYLKAGVYPRFPIYYFGRTPEAISIAGDLAFEPVTASSETLNVLAGIDQVVLDHRRDVDHQWLLTERQGYLYYRNDRPVGYGYLGAANGPFATLDNTDFPAILAHAESEAAAHNRAFGVEVPMVNQAAVDYLLSRDFQLDSFAAIMMTDKPFGKFENYICTSPPFFM